MKTQLSPQDWQQLSAYLDGQLSTTEKERLETRLRNQTNLRTGLEEISQTRAVLRSVPHRKVPHNFTLTRAMVAEQTMRRSAWFPVLSFTSLASLVVLVAVSLLSQFQYGALSAAPAAPVAMQAARAAAQPTDQPMIIQWGNGGIGGGGGGDGEALPQSANPQGLGMGGAQPAVPQANTMMKGQPTPQAGIESGPAATEVSVPALAAPDAGTPTEAPAANSQPAFATPPFGPTPTPPEAGLVPGAPLTATAQAPENTPTSEPVAQEKSVPDQAQGPVILGIAPTQEQGLLQTTPPSADNYQAPSTPFNFLPFVQIGLVALAVVAGIWAFLLRKKSRS
jgi:hypothetical protein